MDKDLIDMLACPSCKAKVQEDNNKIICTKCGLRYPIRDGIPVMIFEEAEKPEGKNG